MNPQDTLQIIDIGSLGIPRRRYRPFFANPSWTYIGADMEAGENVDIVIDGDYKWGKLKQYDVVISGQTLEHVEFPWKFAKALERITKDGGLVILIAPWNWGLHRFPLDCWRILPDGIDALMTKWCSFKKLESGMNRNDCWFVGRK